MPAVADMVATAAGASATYKVDSGFDNASQTASFSRSWTWVQDYPGEQRVTHDINTTAQVRISALSTQLNPPTVNPVGYAEVSGQATLTDNAGHSPIGSSGSWTDHTPTAVAVNTVITATQGAGSYYPMDVISFSGTILSGVHDYAYVTTMGGTATTGAPTATIGSPYIALMP